MLALAQVDRLQIQFDALLGHEHGDTARVGSTGGGVQLHQVSLSFN